MVFLCLLLGFPDSPGSWVLFAFLDSRLPPCFFLMYIHVQVLSAGLWSLAIGWSGPEMAQVHTGGVGQSPALSRHRRSILHSWNFNCLCPCFMVWLLDHWGHDFSHPFWVKLAFPHHFPRLGRGESFKISDLLKPWQWKLNNPPKPAEATVTFTCSLTGVLLRDYSKGHGSHFGFFFPSVISVVASYFKLY